LVCIFKHSDRNDLIFFGHFKNRSVTEKGQSRSSTAFNK